MALESLREGGETKISFNTNYKLYLRSKCHSSVKSILIKEFLIPLPYLVATTFKGIDKINWIYIFNDELSHLVEVISIFFSKSARLETNLDSFGSLLIKLNKEDW